jgi:hypothetical protein
VTDDIVIILRDWGTRDLKSRIVQTLLSDAADEIQRLRAEVDRLRLAGDGLAAVTIDNAPGVSVKGNELAEANDDWDAALDAWDVVRRD